MMTAQDILDGRKAGEIYGVYDDTKHYAATLLVLAGWGHAEYLTQWASGTTAWQYGVLEITVKQDGEITGLPEFVEPEIFCMYVAETRTVTITMPEGSDILDSVLYNTVCRYGFESAFNALVKAAQTRQMANARTGYAESAKAYHEAACALSSISTRIVGNYY